ncbi:hypothetical protein SAMN04487829_0015 [Pseudobutyrivibrio sp. NOR37]|uniref:Uncharacterized protein n=1 Tax=Pseudobutyrivibrio xylanivorans TaxID=185007 RepID=A0A6M0LCR9_PSEXY|nr:MULTISPECIES: hypothetical protein [Pseudobutyrivibrio]NEX00448.1 hypothetical protein [Pseudobutyrivibrio xylanivorans]SFR59696.1 hypothetical protein SAMN04487829_0015 [Pseudobutyrivibrio sp. NOR37]
MNLKFKRIKKGFDTNLAIKKIKNELQIKGNVKVYFNEKKKDSSMRSSGGKEEIIIGTAKYNLEELNESQIISIYNSIYHEFVHVRNRRLAGSTISDSVMNSRTLAHFGYSLLDELSAYSEANINYPETMDVLETNFEELYANLFERLTEGALCLGGRKERTEEDRVKFYNQSLEVCVSLIPLYVISGGIPEDKKYYPFRRAINSLISYGSNFENLILEDYEKIGKEYIENLIYDLSSSKRKNFWINTAIDL